MTLKQNLMVWAALICLLSAQNAHAIINGNLDTTHDSVGAVYYENVAITTGVLVNESWVLTVAHALEYGTASHFIIGDDYNSPGATIYVVDQIIVHPDFDMPGGLPVNNFALLHLATPVTGLDILPLMSSPTLLPGTNVLSIGYGDTSAAIGGENTRRRYITNAIDSTESGPSPLNVRQADRAAEIPAARALSVPAESTTSPESYPTGIARTTPSVERCLRFSRLSRTPSKPVEEMPITFPQRPACCLP